MRIFYIAAGFVSLAFGIAGIFLPVLPTTPFLLLTAWLWFRGSPALYDKLMAHPKIGQYIRDFREERAIPLSTKIYSISLLWITIGSSILVISGKLWLKLLLLLIALLVSIHILGFKTKK